VIKLIPIKSAYAELWQKWRSEQNMIRYNPITQLTLKRLRSNMELMSSDLSKLNDYEEFRFFLQFQDQLIGTINIQEINHTMMYCEIGYVIGEAFQGKGFASRGVELFVEKVFKETQLRKIFAYVAQENVASQRVLLKAGFVQEGICREHYIINGKPTDEIFYGILRSDWHLNHFGIPN